jgi:hypothetical protein
MAQIEFGWAGPKLEREQIARMYNKLAVFSMYGEKADRFCMFDLVKQVNNGQWLKNIPQPDGDCVSRGARGAVESLQAVEIVRLGEREAFTYVYSPYIYSISRMAPECGKGQMGSDAGSTGIWAAEGMKLYGVTPWGDRPYDKQTTQKYGTRMPPRDEIDLGKQHLIKSYSRMRNADDLWMAISNGYPVTIASNKGYEMRTRQKDGKSWFVGNDSWPHQTYINSVDTRPTLCFLITNSWGDDVHGPQLDGPPGSGWITAEQFDTMLRQDGEAYALSQFDGFVAQRPWDWL